MAVEFTIELAKGKSIAMPRVESPTQIMTLGQAGSLDDALRQATSGMVQWLQQDRGLSLSECAQVLGSAVKYSLANLVGRSVEVAAKMEKAILKRRQKLDYPARPVRLPILELLPNGTMTQVVRKKTARSRRA
ncbi:hypothetical protein [Massilia sp. BJB1822]|uniref:hypothetical protein n=1 Tax=Massilia sp. BJB1822 TaxID=2744470 RepID=UPI001C3CA579|nr:hypothetical protein [Massilia sp. BJB1822]